MDYYKQQTIAVWLIIMGIVLYFISTDSDGTENKLEFGCCTYHFQRDMGYNEFNYGLIYHHQVADKWWLSAGGYKNSDYTTSLFVGGTFEYPIHKDWTLAFAVGALSGYDNDLPLKIDFNALGERWLPIVVPKFIYKDTVNLYIIPVDGGGVSMTFTLINF